MIEPTDLDRCRHVAADQPRILIGRHLDGCPREDCESCQPCTRNHCVGRNCHTHVTVERFTCPACVHSARTDLAEIVRMCADLPDEAETKGVASEAFHLNGPTANVEQWRQRGRHGHHYEPDARLGEDHPLWTLHTLERVICDELDDEPPTGRATVDNTAAFIDERLHRLAHQPWFDFADLQADLARARGHLEAVLHDGEQVERVAPCMDCGRQIVRRMTDAGEWAYRCERCAVDLSEATYRLAVKAAHVAHADRLTAEDLATRLNVPLSDVRRWTAHLRVAGDDLPPLLRSCGKSGGRKLYRVADAAAIKDAGDTRRAREDESA